MNILRYNKPAAHWNDALPIGNGRLGAMVFGDTQTERLALNEETLWDGFPIDSHNPKAKDALPKVRDMIFAGKFSEAEALCHETLLGVPERIHSYQALGDLFLTLAPGGKIAGYERTLDLQTATATTTFLRDRVRHTRQVIASAADDCLIVRVTVDTPGALDFTVRLARGDVPAYVSEKGRPAFTPNQTCVVKTEIGHAIRMYGQIERDGRGLNFECHVKILLDNGVGTARPISEDTLEISGATSVTILLAAGSDWRARYPRLAVGDDRRQPETRCRTTIEAASRRPFAELLSRHETEHRRFFDRVTLDLGGRSDDPRPTDARLKAVAGGASDPALCALYFQYGRYLLLGSSRPGGLPANLQGLWCEHFNAPWNADYHTNINLQMNYWHAEAAGLPECHRPLIEYVESLVEPGTKMARDHWGARGWVVHHLSDIFGFTAPADGIWGVWPMGAAWLCAHLYDAWRFDPNPKFLARIYPTLKGATRFLLDFLVEGPDGFLTTCPSHSPENTFRTQNGTVSHFTFGATMDRMIVAECLENTLAAAELLEIDLPLRREIETALSRLTPLKISPRDGRLQEWATDYDEPEPGHRHISHAYALHPGNAITPRATPELCAAFRKSLETRLKNGGGHTGWSRAWIVNLFARLHDGDAAHEHLQLLLGKSTQSNLLDSHPPFQIDGNFGGASGILEMLLQSHAGEIHLLPALPTAWPNGSVTGLRARGGYTIDLAWNAGQLTRAKIHAKHKGPVVVRIADAAEPRVLKLRAGETHTLSV